MTTSKSNVSFHAVNTAIGKMLNPTPAIPYTSFVDEHGSFHTFPTKRDYLMYLEERDLECVGRKS